MKQGEWLKEWNDITNDLESGLKKFKPGMVVQRVYDTETGRHLKAFGKTLPSCDEAYKEFRKEFEESDRDEADDLLKAFSEAHDKFQSWVKKLDKGFKAVNKVTDKKNPPLAKVIGEAQSDIVALDKSIGSAVVGLMMAVKHRNREARKIENVSKSLGEAVKATKQFVNKSIADKDGEYYTDNIEDAGQEMYELLTEIDKMVTKKKEIDNKKAPPKQLVRTAKEFTDEVQMSCLDKDEKVDFAEVKKAVREMLIHAKDVEKWRRATWPK
ncbi:MAG: methyl-accepting chemotaxis protein [Phycisphaerales bacterium]|jgi:methyl-accepting chemotaxis protein